MKYIKQSDVSMMFGNGEFCAEKFFVHTFSSFPFSIDFYTKMENVKNITEFLIKKTKEDFEIVYMRNNISDNGKLYEDRWYLNSEILFCVEESRESTRGIYVKIFCKSEENFKEYFNDFFIR